MPLIMGKSPKSFSRNVSTEMEAGKPLKQSLAIAYAEKRKAKKEHEAYGGHIGYADGGFVKEEMESGYCKECDEGTCMAHGGIVDRAMKKHMMSKGGMVANDEDDEEMSDFHKNDFDDLAMRDDLEFNYTGENSGDELGDEREDEDRHDIVSRVMKEWRKKDRMPKAGVSHYGT
jgi:hypothetical protein